MKLTTATISVMICLLLSGLVGCSHTPQKQVDPTPLAGEQLANVGTELGKAEAELAKPTVDLEIIKEAIKGARFYVIKTAAELQSISKKFIDTDTARVSAETEVNKLNDQFWSPKQKRYAWIFGILCVVLGVMAAVGNVVPGWWSLPALWVIKVFRFVIFAGIPHLVQAIVAGVKLIRDGLRHRAATDQSAASTSAGV